ncbi:MAG: hypothetical protein H3C50_11145 [Kiritimatiellae bacterium]|nr:hypothetical protein [Kiritimatiellia bacterium]MCO5062064.1 hypothetical protein [Kiritimatiellia bacterium]
MAIFALISYGMFKELYFDKYIRKSIIAELGLNYIVLMIATCFIPVVFGAVGFIRKRNAANNRFERTGYPRHVGCLRTRRAAVRPSAQP